MTQPKRSIKTNRNRKSARKAKRKLPTKPTKTAAPNPDCPYRPGTLYARLFIEANEDCVAKEELIKKVARQTE